MPLQAMLGHKLWYMAAPPVEHKAKGKVTHQIFILYYVSYNTTDKDYIIMSWDLKLGRLSDTREQRWERLWRK